MNVASRTATSLLAAAAVLSAAALASVLVSVGPREASIGTVGTVYASALIFLASALAVILHASRSRGAALGPAVRQSVLTASAFVSLLALRAGGQLSLGNALPLLAAAMLLELFFRAEKRPLVPLASTDDRSAR